MTAPLTSLRVGRSFIRLISLYIYISKCVEVRLYHTNGCTVSAEYSNIAGADNNHNKFVSLDLNLFRISCIWLKNASTFRADDAAAEAILGYGCRVSKSSRGHYFFSTMQISICLPRIRFLNLNWYYRRQHHSADRKRPKDAEHFFIISGRSTESRETGSKQRTSNSHDLIFST